jgi:hypothetical protein
MLGASILGTSFLSTSGGDGTPPSGGGGGGGGVVPSTPDDRDWVYDPAKDLPLPTAFDLLEYAGLVEDQKTTNSCLANATVSALEILLSRSKSFKDLSRLFLYWYLRADAGLTGDSGAYPRDGFKTANKRGICSEYVWPFDTDALSRAPSAAAESEAVELKAYGYYKILTGRSDTIDNIKIAIASGYPVVLAVNIAASFSNIRASSLDGTIPLFKNTSQDGNAGGHALLAVGYTSDGNLLVENSWGYGWGYKGNAYLPIASLMTDVFEIWTCTGLNGVAVPPLLKRPVWSFDYSLPRPTLQSAGVNNPQDNLAELTLPVQPTISFQGGANSYLSSQPLLLNADGTSTVWGQSNVACPTPTLSVTGRFATQGRANLTFGYSNGGNYSISAAVGAKTTLSAPAAMVSASSTTGSSGRAALQSTHPTTLGYSGLVARLALPKAMLTVSMVKGNTAVIAAPRFNMFALGLTGGVGKAAATSYASLAAYSGGSAYLTPQAPYINSALRAGTLGSAELRSSRVSVSACSGASGNLRSGRCSVSANSRTGGAGRMILNMASPSTSGHWGGHFYGVLP